VAISNGFVDLHTHTTASDGVCSPTENVRLAAEAGLAAIAITDHDTINGIAEAQRAGVKYNVIVIPGVEISTAVGRRDIHILGYNCDLQDATFTTFLHEQQNVRGLRNIRLVERLAELDIYVSIDEILAQTPTLEGRADSIGRPHFAQALIRLGLVQSMDEAFKAYLAPGGKAFVTIPRIAPEVAIDCIRAAGGLAVIAHPGLYQNDELVKHLLEYGVDGIEAYHSDHTVEQEMKYQAWADAYGIMATAGSDFHGSRNGDVYHGPIGYRKTELNNVMKIIEAHIV
jgi:predicted metal-dependent phosphoesterase TrpH